MSGAGTIMNVVGLTAALSSLPAGLYSTGRILRSLAMNGSAPRFLTPMSRHGVPYGRILLTAGVGYLGVVLNAIAPGQAFGIVLSLASLGIIAGWATDRDLPAPALQLGNEGIINRPAFRMPFAPYNGYATLVFPATVTRARRKGASEFVHLDDVDRATAAWLEMLATHES